MVITELGGAGYIWKLTDRLRPATVFKLIIIIIARR